MNYFWWKKRANIYKQPAWSEFQDQNNDEINQSIWYSCELMKWSLFHWVDSTHHSNLTHMLQLINTETSLLHFINRKSSLLQSFLLPRVCFISWYYLITLFFSLICFKEFGLVHNSNSISITCSLKSIEFSLPAFNSIRAKALALSASTYMLNSSMAWVVFPCHKRYHEYITAVSVELQVLYGL